MASAAHNKSPAQHASRSNRQRKQTKKDVPHAGPVPAQPAPQVSQAPCAEALIEVN
jgi:hypothetical protein